LVNLLLFSACIFRRRRQTDALSREQLADRIKQNFFKLAKHSKSTQAGLPFRSPK
jgi:hypothetical protein